MVIEVIEEFLVIDHLGLSVKEHGGSLTEVLTSIEPLAHAVVVETLTSVLEDVDTVDSEGLSSFEQDLLGVEEGLTSGLKLLNISFTDRGTVLHDQTDLADELAKLEDAISDGHV